jgi:hypothetical protein
MADSPTTSNDAQRAFERGDFLTARKLAAELAASQDEATRSAGKLILSRTSFDPAIIWISLACLGFFVLVVALALH